MTSAPAPREGRPLRILTLIAQFWPIVGGAENQARRLAGALSTRGHHVEIWTGRWSPRHPRSEWVDAVQVLRLGPSLPPWPLRLRRYLFAARLFRRLLAEGARYDVILVHQLLYPAFVATLAGRLVRRPVVARVSSTGSTSDLRMSGGGLGLQRAVTRRLLDRVVCMSVAAERELLSAGYPAARIVRIPNGVAPPSEVPRRAEPVEAELCGFCYVGGLRAEKRLDLLLEAWRLAGEPGRLELVGDGSERPRVERLAAGLANVHVVGPLQDPWPSYARARVFVLASDAEGMSNALLEAMASGLACVATWVGGNPDLLGPELSVPPDPGMFAVGSAGLLVRRDDAIGLAAALRAFSADAALRNRLGTAARARCLADYGLDRVAAAYESLFDSLLRERPSQPVHRPPADSRV